MISSSQVNKDVAEFLILIHDVFLNFTSAWQDTGSGAQTRCVMSPRLPEAACIPATYLDICLRSQSQDSVWV